MAKVATEASRFSLHHNPRTPSGILKSFLASDASHLLRLCKKMQSLTFDSKIVEKLHCHFLQSLTNIHLRALSAPLVPDLASLRSLIGERADFVPVSTILGALIVFEIFKLLQSRRDALLTYRLSLPSLLNGGGLGAYKLQMSTPPTPMQMRSLTIEATRGGPLRVVPEKFTAWSRISIPLSQELQSVDAIVNFIQVGDILCYCTRRLLVA